LLRRTFRRWVSGDVEVDNASSIVCEDDKDEEDFKPNGLDRKEVDGSELRDVIIEECSPISVCDGGFGLRLMYLATEAPEILMPNFIRSL
jgi:hypothetical protein